MKRILATLLVLSLSACTGEESTSSDTSSGISSSLSACTGSSFFTSLPIALADLRGLVPLGALNPSGHTFPTDHIYFYIQLTDPSNSASDPKNVNVYAPGDVRITDITAQENISTSPSYTDYTIVFYPCAELKAYFGHVQSLDPSISAQIGAIDSNCQTYTTGGNTFKSCSKTVSIDVTSGTKIGTAGRKGQTALDLGAYDSRITPTGFANLSRFNTNYPYAVCPVDYFLTSLKSQIEARFGSYDGTTLRTTLPVCGTVGQDIAGTAQGIWFKPNSVEVTEDPHLALVHDNVNPSTAVFSVGTSVTNVSYGTYTFTPQSSGFVNRDFKDVTADGSKYCYATNEGVVFMLEIASSTSLHIQKLDQQNCNTMPDDFDSSTVTFER